MEQTDTDTGDLRGVVKEEMSIYRDKRMEIFEEVVRWIALFPEKDPRFEARLEPTQKPDMFDIIFRWTGVLALRMACLTVKEDGYPVFVEGGDLPRERANDAPELQECLMKLCKCAAFRTRYSAMLQLLKLQPI